MHLNNSIPSDKEIQWVAFLNGETDTPKAPIPGTEEITGLTALAIPQ
jgi:hypothetical protein